MPKGVYERKLKETFRCDNCGREFPSKQSLTGHRSRVGHHGIGSIKTAESQDKRRVGTWDDAINAMLIDPLHVVAHIDTRVEDLRAQIDQWGRQIEEAQREIARLERLRNTLQDEAESAIESHQYKPEVA